MSDVGKLQERRYRSRRTFPAGNVTTRIMRGLLLLFLVTHVRPILAQSQGNATGVNNTTLVEEVAFANVSVTNTSSLEATSWRANVSSPANMILSSLHYFDQMTTRVAPPLPYNRRGHVDHYPDQNVSICRFVDLNFHSLTISEGVRIPHPFNFGPQAVAAYALALEHLNTRDSSVISELADLPCGNLKFTAEFFDTSAREYLAVDAATSTLARTEQKPCAFTGAGYSSVTMASAVVTGVHGYPQMSPLSTAGQLEDREQFPLFARLVTKSGTEAAPLLDLFHNILEVKFLTVVYTEDPAALSIVNEMSTLHLSRYPDLQVSFIAIPSDTSDFSHALNEIKKKGVRYIFSILSEGQAKPFFSQAYEHGVAGDGKHVWVPMANLLGDLQDEFSPRDPFFLAVKGMIRFGAAGSLPDLGRYQSFIEKWQKLANSTSDLEYLQSLLPALSETDPNLKATIDASTFSAPSMFTPVIYDMVMLLGMAACRAGESFSGEDHFREIFNTTFLGASRYLALDRETGSLNGDSFMGALTNIRPRLLQNGNYTVDLVDVGTYVNREWKMEAAIEFNDGTTNIPPDLPPLVVEYNYIGGWLRGVGFALAATVISTSFVASAWTVRGRVSSRVIRASQPIFLLWMTTGTALLGASIVPLAVDDQLVENPWCMAFPWLFALGWSFVFSALFSKTMRVNKIFHNPRFTRIRVTPVDVMMPMAVLLAGEFGHKIQSMRSTSTFSRPVPLHHSKHCYSPIVDIS